MYSAAEHNKLACRCRSALCANCMLKFYCDVILHFKRKLSFKVSQRLCASSFSQSIKLHWRRKTSNASHWELSLPFSFAKTHRFDLRSTSWLGFIVKVNDKAVWNYVDISHINAKLMLLVDWNRISWFIYSKIETSSQARRTVLPLGLKQTRPKSHLQIENTELKITDEWKGIWKLFIDFTVNSLEMCSPKTYFFLEDNLGCVIHGPLKGFVIHWIQTLILDIRMPKTDDKTEHFHSPRWTISNYFSKNYSKNYSKN